MYTRDNVHLSVDDNRWKLRNTILLPDKQYFWAPLGNFYSPSKVPKWYVQFDNIDKRANKKFFVKTKQDYEKQIIRVRKTSKLNPILSDTNQKTSDKCILL